MKYDEYESRINNILSNPDTALAEIGGVLEELKVDLTALENVTAESETQAARIKDLQDTNMKLYLSLAGDTTEEDNEEHLAEGTEVIDEFLKLIEEEEVE